ncbi:hypothetical protein VVR12_02375 [Rothia sp. LK2588]|uniref:hypothetical protein n=1 Tax=Rothia sp. LK2588 TaxID=3114369 RepID=UPI0034CDA507
MSMKNSHLSLLDLLPYPLNPPTGPGEPQLMGQTSVSPPATVRKRATIVEQIEQEHRAARLYGEQLINLRPLNLTPTETQAIVADHRLQHVCLEQYVMPQVTVTPMLRAVALSRHVRAQYRRRGRISRHSAAWIWGYASELTLPIHLDFDRQLRLNMSRARFEDIQVHQVRTIPYDSLPLAELNITTPSRTALDLLLFEPSSDELLSAIISDPASDCTLRSLRRALDNTKYVKHRDAIEERLFGLAARPKNKS